MLKQNVMILAYCVLLGSLQVAGCYRYEPPDETGENVVELKRLMTRFNLRQYETVIPLVKKHLKKFPDSRGGNQILGFSYLGLGETEKAQAVFKKGLEKWPDWYFGHIGQARLCRQREAFTEAKGHYQKALEVKPDSIESFIGLATVDLCEGRFDSAVSNAEKALKVNDKDSAAWCTAAIAYSYAGNTEKSKAAAKKATELKYPHTKAMSKILTRQLNPYPVRKKVKSKKEEATKG